MKYKINIPPNANKIIHTLQSAGYKAFIVGGCVRDSIMNRPPHDWDICTSARPDRVIDIFKNYNVVKTGLQHGTVTIIINDEQYECTSFRIDGEYTDNRRPNNITFVDNLLEDLKRRDFTINAIAYNDEDGLIDPFDGIGDIKRGIIQCVGEAEDRFHEDILRILRAIRFAAQLNFSIEDNTDAEIRQQFTNLNNISVERITSEFNKIVISDSFFGIMMEYRVVFAELIPELRCTFMFPQNNPHHSFDLFTHILWTVAYCPKDDLIIRLAALFHDIGKPRSYQDGEDGIRHFKGHGQIGADITDTIMRRLKYDNDTRNKVVQLVYYHDATFKVGKKYVKRWLNKLGEEQFRRLLHLRRGDIKGQKLLYDTEKVEVIDTIEKLIDEVLQENQCFTLKNLAINGNDLIQIGYEPNKKLGETLNMLLNGVINEEYENDKDILLSAAKQLIESEE